MYFQEAEKNAGARDSSHRRHLATSKSQKSEGDLQFFYNLTLRPGVLPALDQWIRGQPGPVQYCRHSPPPLYSAAPALFTCPLDHPPQPRLTTPLQTWCLSPQDAAPPPLCSDVAMPRYPSWSWNSRELSQGGGDEFVDCSQPLTLLVILHHHHLESRLQSISPSFLPNC